MFKPTIELLLSVMSMKFGYGTKKYSFEQESVQTATQVLSGTMSYRQACTNAVRTLAQSGLRHVDYESGITRQLDTAALNAVRTSLGQLTGEISQANIEDNGVEMVQVSQHWGARESHALWQGGIYTVEQFKAVCGYGEPSNPDHIYSYNCRHVHYPYWPGVSEPLEYQPKPGPFEVNGRQYSYYQATQKQRSMERDIRATKRDAMAQDALGDKSALAAAKIKLDEKMAAYKGFSSQINMRARLERTTVFGYDRGVSARGWTVAKLVKEIKAAGNLSDKAYVHLSPVRLNVEELSFDDVHTNSESKHKVTRGQAESWINSSKISVTVWGGMYERYFSADGAVYVNLTAKNIRTAYSASQYDERVKAMMEVLKKYGY